jgi:hypothetical protein
MKIERRGPFGPFKLQMALAQSCKTHRLVYVDIQILQLLMGGMDQWGVNKYAFNHKNSERIFIRL